MRPTDPDPISLIERQLWKSRGTNRFDGAVDPAERCSRAGIRLLGDGTINRPRRLIAVVRRQGQVHGDPTRPRAAIQ